LSEQLFHGTDLVFIISGIGGVAGTVSTPIVAEAARDAGAVVTTIATFPHTLERDRRIRAGDDIQEFKNTSDTLVLIDAGRFAVQAGNISPGKVFDQINEYLGKAIRQMVNHRRYIGDMGEGTDHTGLASFFRNGGIATLTTASSPDASGLEDVQQKLFGRSLVDQASECTGDLLHLVRVNWGTMSEEDSGSLVTALMNEPSGLSPKRTNVNIVGDTEMEDAIRLTSIVTGLDISIEDIIGESTPAESASEATGGSLKVLGDNTSAISGNDKPSSEGRNQTAAASTNPATPT
jgi:cell division protein FtsZ